MYGIVALHGPSTSGKSTLARMASMYLPNPVRLFSNAAVLRRTSAAMFDLPLFVFSEPYKDVPFSELARLGGPLHGIAFPRKGTNRAFVNLDDIEVPNTLPLQEVIAESDWTPRKILNAFGASNDRYPQMTWANGVIEGIGRALNNGVDKIGDGHPPLFFITDVRYPHEYLALRQLENAEPAVLLPVNIEPGTVDRSSTHYSEHALDSNADWHAAAQTVLTRQEKCLDYLPSAERRWAAERGNDGYAFGSFRLLCHYLHKKGLLKVSVDKVMDAARNAVHN